MILMMAMYHTGWSMIPRGHQWLKKSMAPPYTIAGFTYYEWVSKLQTWGHNITNIPDQIQMNMTSSPYHSKHVLHPSSRDPPIDIGPSCIHQNFAGVFPYIRGKGLYDGTLEVGFALHFLVHRPWIGMLGQPQFQRGFLSDDWPLWGEWHGFMINLTVFKVGLRIHSKWSYW